MSLLDIPPEYRSISPYIKVGLQFKDSDNVVYYWILNYAVEKALAIGHSNQTSKNYLVMLLETLEKVKNAHPGNESYAIGPVSQCHVEDKALKLFTAADEQDRQGIFNKNVIKCFYTAGLLFDVVTLFTKEELEEKLQEARKYAKWKATEINNCLKEGRTPRSGPPLKEGENDELTRELLSLDVNKPKFQPRTTSNVPASDYPSNLVNYPPTEPHHPNVVNPNVGWQQPQQFNTGYMNPTSYPSQQQFGGYQAQQEQKNFHNVPGQTGQSSEVTLDDFIEARKLCKMAVSALDYEDAKTAIDFLRKTLKILEK